MTIDLDAVVREIFATMLGAACEPDAMLAGADELGAEISFGWPWQGRCLLSLGCGAATEFVCMMAGDAQACRAEDAGADELRADAVRELCNMIAGGWKNRQPSAHGTMSPPRSVTPTAIETQAWTLERTYRSSRCAFRVCFLLSPLL